jgi:ubiquinone/menaquinone biosynthesis C-methylase UbiE
VTPDGVDIEALAAGYRLRGSEDAVLARDAALAAALGPGDLALDIGGGPGAHATVLAATGATVVVVDPSAGMVRRATLDHPVIRGRGEALPVGDSAVDLAYFHLSIHHGDPAVMLSEAVRACRPGGLVWVWTLAPDHHTSSFLAHWFPTVAEIDSARFPDPGLLADHLAAAGCEAVGHFAETFTRTRRAGEWAAAVRAGFVSTLQLVSPQELAAGLARFAEEHPDPDGEIHYEQRYARVSARTGAGGA